MEWAIEATAVVVAVVSVVVALLARRDSSRSAAASERSATASETAAEAAKRSAWYQSEDDWRARQPTFEVEWNDVIAQQGDAKTYGATLKSLGLERYGETFMRVLNPPGTESGVVHNLIDLRSFTSGRQVELGPIDVGERIRFGVVPEFDAEGYRRGGLVDLQVTVRTADDGEGVDEWTVSVTLDVPHIPRVYVT